MTRQQTWMGFLATILLLSTLVIALLREPTLQTRAADAQLQSAVTEGISLYLENCIVCHGASGEGLGAYPSLSAAAGMDATELYKVIERGRYGTQMAAYGVDEGGVFTQSQINALISLIQYGNWETVYAYADAADIIPPEPVVMEISEETLSQVSSLPDGDILSDGLMLYAENCASCHGSNLEGTTLAPALDTDTLRATDSYEIIRRIEQGVPGTLMASWDAALTDTDIAALTTLILRWPDIQAAGVEMPVIVEEPIDMSPEAIASGERLFNIVCASCHGAAGYGTQLAPALNNALFLDATSDAQIRQIVAMGVSGTVMPAWGGRLSDAQINDIIAYLRSLAPTAPTITTPR